MFENIFQSLRGLGAWVIDALWKLGFASRFLLAIVMQSGPLFLRPSLLIREIFFAGVLSLIIIMVSGLFVGMVLALQGYNLNFIMSYEF